MTKSKEVLRLAIPKTVRLPMKGRKLMNEDRVIIANRYQLGDSYSTIEKELGCSTGDISATAQQFKLTPRNPKLMGKPHKNGNRRCPPDAKATAARANAALQAADMASPMLHPYASIQRLTAEYLGQLQGLVHQEITRIEIIKTAIGTIALTYDLVERHTQQWP